jgi:glycine cleavage system transcriptional repressor
MQQYVISIMTRDRVGIIADVTSVLQHLRANLSDLSQTVLRGHFTMILLARFPEGATPARIREALLNIDRDDPLEVGIREVSSELPPEPDRTRPDRYVLTAVGPDKIGLVAGVTQYLRHKNINIEDLATRVDGDRYTMILLLDLPPELHVPRLQRGIQVAMDALGVEAKLQHYGVFRATNEI